MHAQSILRFDLSMVLHTSPAQITLKFLLLIGNLSSSVFSFGALFHELSGQHNAINAHHVTDKGRYYANFLYLSAVML
jgi:hypothetical protein